MVISARPAMLLIGLPVLILFYGMTMNGLADEGMWLLNDPPRDLLAKKYQFDLTAEWLERAQGASIRFNNGGSGSFVSPEGLIVTNHHIGADSLQKLSTKDHDLLREGFLARTRDQERKCPDLELNVLQSILDVTDQVNAAVKPQMTPAEAFAARRAIMATIEQKSLEETRFRSDIVTLYQGGAYHLYRYKKYTDIRLVFAPEHAIAFFGGDTDNFEYPRFNLDICFFRAYENDQPVRPKHYFHWSQTGPQSNDLVFVTGHPGTTNRLETLAKLQHRRDHTLPYNLTRLRAMEALLIQFSEKDPENRRAASKDYHRVANSRKAFSGQYQGLLDPAILARKMEEENQLRNQIVQDPEKKKKYESAWEQVAQAEKKFASFEREYYLIERGDAFDSDLFGIARHLVRLVQEKSRPSSERLREYRDSALESLKFQLFSPAPISSSLEKARLATSLTFLAEQLGGDDSFVQSVFAGKPPAARANELIEGSRLQDVSHRKTLANQGIETIQQCSDPLIQLALQIDPRARELRKRFESEVEEVERQANGRIANARFEMFGKGVAPDATFTLRIAFGVVKGYSVDGLDLNYFTTFQEAFAKADRLGNREPFSLPERWLKARGQLDLATPFNFVSTADTIGGNSGSPVLNRAGELVGINFDRNRHGLVRNFVYTDQQARHIAVHSRGVLVALKSLYGAIELLAELTGEK